MSLKAATKSLRVVSLCRCVCVEDLSFGALRLEVFKNEKLDVSDWTAGDGEGSDSGSDSGESE